MATILVVDDEFDIREIARRVLQRQGHTVVLCEGATDALAVSAAIDLLLVDRMLPGMDGLEIAARLRTRRPRLPVVVMSGYPVQPETMPDPPSVFLQKPMLPGVIVTAVNALLREAASGPAK